jgi:phosphohistidine phosphatase SixA
VNVLLRHASAGDRDAWEGDDRARPLDRKGRKQSERLATELQGRGIQRIVSSPYVRCVQTVEPLARALGVPVETDERLAEGASRDDALELVREATVPTVLCTHGDVVEELLGRHLKKGALAEL